MQPITLNTKKRPVRNIEIDGIGFKVRSLGAGEMLSVGKIQRILNKAKGDTSEEGQALMFDGLDGMMNLIRSTFDDGKDGVETEKLLNRLDPEDLGLLLEQLFTKDESGQTA